MIWTVFFTTACIGPDGISHQGIGAEEFFGPHDITEARKAASTYGSTILAMVPGSHVNKTYLFDREYEHGRKPVSYQGRSGTTAR
jgi:hypothetical protein